MRLAAFLALTFPMGFSTGLSEGLPDTATIESATMRAIETMRGEFSSGGGYASHWTLSPFSGSSEHRTSPTVISIQPPGTTTLGRSFLRLYRITGNPVALEAGRETALCLTRCQLSSGGWQSDYDSDPDYADKYHFRWQVLSGDKDPAKRRHHSTLDDNKTQSALLLLLDWVMTEGAPPTEAIENALEFGLESLLAAQRRNGGWPQQFDGTFEDKGEPRPAAIPTEWPREWPGEPYSDLVTLNDNNLFHILQVLLRAEEWKRDGRFLDSSRRLGDFLLLAQLPGPQSGWAQQYNEKMEPTWARKFEPPALASVESFGAMETLFELWLATGEERYRNAILPALDWLETSVIEGGKWARFYELGTNRPLYMEAESYRLTYDDSNLPTHYGFQIDAGFARKLEKMRDALAESREHLLEERNRVRSPTSWGKRRSQLAPLVERILEAQAASGVWTEEGKADAKTWSRNLETLADYLEATKQSAE